MSLIDLRYVAVLFARVRRPLYVLFVDERLDALFDHRYARGEGHFRLRTHLKQQSVTVTREKSQNIRLRGEGSSHNDKRQTGENYKVDNTKN